MPCVSLEELAFPCSPCFLCALIIAWPFGTTHPFRYEAKTGLTISDEELAKCICLCIEPESISECACPLCTDIGCEILALRGAIGCATCKGGPWPSALVSISAFSRALSCSDEVIPCMRRAGSDEDFTCRPLRCCVASGEVAGVAACPNCTFSLKLPKGVCDCFARENLDREWTWLKRQPTIEGKNHDKVTVRLHTYKGTVSELLQSVEAKAKPYLHHAWLASFARLQFHLDCDYMNEATEAVLLADFSTAMILGSGYKATCETDATANLYVVLVLYSVGGVKMCDYVRFWSSAATSAEFHHAAMHAVAKHLRDSGKVPGLKRLRVWADGHGSTYKGEAECCCGKSKLKNLTCCLKK